MRSVKVDSDDPLHFSTHSVNSLPSFVGRPVAAAPEAAPSQVESGDAMDGNLDGDYVNYE